MTVILAWCETCQCEVQALAEYHGYHEGANQYEITQGVAADDDIHVDERHDLSTIG